MNFSETVYHDQNWEKLYSEANIKVLEYCVKSRLVTNTNIRDKTILVKKLERIIFVINCSITLHDIHVNNIITLEDDEKFNQEVERRAGEIIGVISKNLVDSILPLHNI